MWAIPTCTRSDLKKNQVKGPSIWSRIPKPVRIRQSGRTWNRGVTKLEGIHDLWDLIWNGEVNVQRN